jgi:hypothetical protein
VIHPLKVIAIIGVCFYILILVIAKLRKILLKGRKVASGLTWDCGYSKPTPSMQYTASSFAGPIVDFFKGILRTKKHRSVIKGYFPEQAFFHTETFDLFGATLFRPMIKGINRVAEKLTWIQHGQLQIYILYIFFALIALFIWKL